jgi:hypothetical protein
MTFQPIQVFGSADTTYLVTKEAARFLKLSHRTLEEWRQLDSGPAYRRMGRRILYRLCDLIDFVEQGALPSTMAVQLA